MCLQCASCMLLVVWYDSYPMAAIEEFQSELQISKFLFYSSRLKLLGKLSDQPADHFENFKFNKFQSASLLPVSIPIWGRVSRSFDINDSGHYRPREFLGESPWKTLEETDSFDQLAVPWEDVDKQPSHSEPFQELLQESPQESQPATLRSDRLWRGHLPFLDEKVLISMPSKASTARTVLTHCFRFHRRVNELRAWSTQVQTSRLQRVLLQSEPFRSLQNFSQNPRVIRLWIAFHRNRLPPKMFLWIT